MSHQVFRIQPLHRAGVFRENFDGQLLVLCFPPFDVWMRISTKDKLDIFLDIPLLFGLVMQGNVAKN